MLTRGWIWTGTGWRTTRYVASRITAPAGAAGWQGGWRPRKPKVHSTRTAWNPLAGLTCELLYRRLLTGRKLPYEERPSTRKDAPILALAREDIRHLHLHRFCPATLAGLRFLRVDSFCHRRPLNVAPALFRTVPALLPAASGARGPGARNEFLALSVRLPEVPHHLGLRIPSGCRVGWLSQTRGRCQTIPWSAFGCPKQPVLWLDPFSSRPGFTLNRLVGLSPPRPARSQI